MRELHPRRLGKIQVQLLLKMFVHDIYHAVAESPERKKEDEEEKGEGNASSILDDEHAATRGVRIHPRGSSGTGFCCCCCRCPCHIGLLKMRRPSARQSRPHLKCHRYRRDQLHISSRVECNST